MNSPATNTSLAGNVVDRAADSADMALRATQRAAESALNSVSSKVHDLRDTASPVVDRITAPFEAASAYTQEAPFKSLLMAAAVGAALMALFSLLGRSSR